MAVAKDKIRSTRKTDGPDRVIDLRDTTDVISIDEVARRLDIPKHTLYDWRYRGVGPRSHRVGRHLRYRWSDVLSWLDAQE